MWIFSVVLIFSIVSFGRSDDVLGCNGFVKSDLNIDLSKVFVKLFTKQGSLKDKTECAPTNGYYFLPLYDKGDYIIRVSTPSGWSFDPPEVAISVDGVNDPCSQGKDINFVFNGFAISGKVVSEGLNLGPSGIKIALLETGATDPIKSVLTEKGGSFVFTSIKPGSYDIRASHQKWALGKSEIKVNVKDSNGEIKDGSLTVLGYDVSGSVTSENQPISGVTFILLSKKTKVKGVGCDVTPLEGISQTSHGHFICHVSSNAKGQFVFPQLPPDDYTIVPLYRGTGAKFNIAPTKMDFTLSHSSLVLPTVFQIQGFSVSGRVLWSEGGKPISGVQVFVNDVHISTTDAKGIYTLDSMKATSYRISFKADGVIFNEIEMQSSRVITDVYPSRFRVSGSLKPPGPAQIFISGDGISLDLPVDAATGAYSAYLPPGVFLVSIKQGKEIITQYSPKERKIIVKDGIIEKMDFTQLRSTINGKIICLIEPCPEVQISLKSTGGGSAIQTTAKGGVYSFKDVLPGDYDLFVEKLAGRCWEKEMIPITVSSEITTAEPFTQSGYIFPIVSSHAAIVTYSSADGKFKGELKVDVGGTEACVPSVGPYTIIPRGCHSYKESSYKWSAGSPPVRLLALSHSFKFSLLTTEVSSDLKMTATYPNDPTRSPSNVEMVSKKSIGRATNLIYNIMLREGSTVQLVPSSLSLLFTPLTAQITGENDCVDNSEQPLFTAELGLVLKGHVITTDNKGLEGVTITVVSSDGDILATLKSVQDGYYSSPPIRKISDYKVKAEKEGYVISGPNSAGDFSAHKLAEIIVKVVDKADNTPLQGVLLSLSGGEKYRRNAQTSEEGLLSFHSLSPGEYFLRPMMKEYKFTPGSQTISVKEGATRNIDLSGVRVAYSGIGVVSSLNGDGEPGITVEAVGIGNCHLLQEETTSGPNGQFRIRGLQSGCEYDVRVKKGAEINQHIFKSSPDSIRIKVMGVDVKGLELYAFRSLGKTDIMVHVSVFRPDDMKTLRVKLTREDSSDHAVSSVKLSEYRVSSTYTLPSVIVALPSVPSDGANYLVSLETTLGRSTHDYALRPVRVTADAPVRVARLSFEPTPKARDPDPTSSSYLVLPLILLALVAYHYRQQISNLITTISQPKNDESPSMFSEKRKQKLKKI